MPKFSSLGIKVAQGFKGSYIPITSIIDNKISLNVENYEVRPSCMHGSQMCIMQISINGRPMVTWHGSQNLINILNECRTMEEAGKKCFPLEDCTIVEGDDGGYYFADADNSCLKPTMEKLDEICKGRTRRFSRRSR